eukprot:gnl/MRDRNA2_/MRDRNA2_82515_c0_seq3.p1 gnl/MRDRNA2_/MRDRNA2_82515_c0~~gnl/MRDRNA2_/MRDRNA2_82515_c0_seq3.p1  ORF type:complete len:244 (+),score=56.31 gnl/MRDRNA2_/MRDRNA2_82515_c0_seq3:2-733(+)
MQVAEIPQPVTSIVYTDEDVAIGKPLGKFMEMVQNLETQNHTLALFRDTGAAAGELHTGVVVMFPGPYTDECLQAWGKKLTKVEIGSAEPELPKLSSEDAVEDALDNAEEDALDQDSNEDAADTIFKENQLLDEERRAMGPDQRALGATKACKKSDDHKGIKILPGRYFWLPTPEGLEQNQRSVFVHFTNTGRWKQIPHNTIKSYLKRIGVPKGINPTGALKKGRAQMCAEKDEEASEAADSA